MRKLRTLVILGGIFVWLLAPGFALASSNQTIDDILGSGGGNGQTVEEPDAQSQGGNNSGGETTKSGSSIVDDLKDAAEIDTTVDVQGTQAISRLVSTVVKYLSYAITALLAVVVLLDLCYVAIPFSRKLLANGHTGVPTGNGGGPAPGMQGMQGMPGMGMGMQGMGMGAGMGMGGYNRYGGGMAGMAGMAGGAGAMGAQGAQGDMTNFRIRFVSAQAMNAVASEGTMSPDGKPMRAATIYAKSMIVLLVAVPVLIVLSSTGVVVQLGIMVGDLVARLIGGVRM